jgi:hypothetical protein
MKGLGHLPRLLKDRGFRLSEPLVGSRQYVNELLPL